MSCFVELTTPLSLLLLFPSTHTAPCPSLLPPSELKRSIAATLVEQNKQTTWLSVQHKSVLHGLLEQTTSKSDKLSPLTLMPDRYTGTGHARSAGCSSVAGTETPPNTATFPLGLDHEAKSAFSFILPQTHSARSLSRSVQQARVLCTGHTYLHSRHLSRTVWIFFREGVRVWDWRQLES